LGARPRAPSGTRDNWGALLNQRQARKSPGDKYANKLYRMKDRNLI
jgi:hypothetical protein